jgi:hypothetical protein
VVAAINMANAVNIIGYNTKLTSTRCNCSTIYSYKGEQALRAGKQGQFMAENGLQRQGKQETGRILAAVNVYCGN